MTHTKTASVILGASALALVLTACSGGGGDTTAGGDADGSTTIKVAYQKTDSFTQLDDLLQKCGAEFEAAHEGAKVSYEPIAALETEYFTKLALMQGSPSTAPDVIFEDTFQVRSDAAAGYLASMDTYLDSWEDWSQFSDAAKQAGLGDDGQTYGVSMGTDTRAIFFNKDVFEQAGLPEDWQPKDWNEILEAARTIKEKVPDVIPFNIFASKAQGEGTSMQGFEMLLYGTDDTLYDFDTKKWNLGTPGFEDSLAFIKTAADEKLLAGLEDMLDTNWPTRVSNELFPAGKVGFMVNGSWTPGAWMEGGSAHWPEWEETVGLAKMPTQNGQAPGATSMSGGWLLSIGSASKNPELAFDLISTCLNKENSFKYDTENSQIAVREDVATDPAYIAFNPTFEFFSSLVPVTHFRPATPDYSQVSSQIQIASESVLTGQASPESAMKQYDEAVTGLVGTDNVQTTN